MISTAAGKHRFGQSLQFPLAFKYFHKRPASDSRDNIGRMLQDESILTAGPVFHLRSWTRYMVGYRI